MSSISCLVLFGHTFV